MGCLLQIALYLLLLPVSLLLTTPVILITALRGEEEYWPTVKQYYRRVLDFWADSLKYWPTVDD